MSRQTKIREYIRHPLAQRKIKRKNNNIRQQGLGGIARARELGSNPVIENTRLIRDTGVVNTRTYEAPQDQTIKVMEAFLMAAVSNTINVYRSASKPIPKLSIIFNTNEVGNRPRNGGNEFKIFSVAHLRVSPRSNGKALVLAAIREYVAYMDQYLGYDVISTVTISALTISGSNVRVRGADGVRAPMAHNNWFLVNPVSKINCGWQAIAIVDGWSKYPKLMSDADAQIEAGADLKRRAEMQGSLVVSAVEWQTLATYKNVVINVRNALYQVIETYKTTKKNTKKTRTLNVVACAGHAYACIQKKLIPAAGFNMSELRNAALSKAEVSQALLTDIVEGEDAVVAKYRDSKKETGPISVTIDNGRNPTRRIAAYDLEAYPDENGNFVPYGIGWAFRNEAGDMTYDKLWGEDCIKVFLEKLAAMDNPPKVWYAHNGGRFDSMFLIKEMVEQTALKIAGMVELNGLMQLRIESTRLRNIGSGKKIRTVVYEDYKKGRNGWKEQAKEMRAKHIAERRQWRKWIAIGLADQEELDEFIKKGDADAAEFKNENKSGRETVRPFVMSFQDSMRMLTGSLDMLTKQLKVDHGKLTGSVDHDLINAKTWRGYVDSGVLDKYLEYDVLGLFEVMEMFNEQVLKEKGIAPADCLTGASLSKRVCFKNYLSKMKGAQVDYDSNSGRVKCTVPIHTLGKEHDEYVRRGYFGGRVEVFKRGHGDTDMRYYDFTSHFPAEGRKDLPLGAPALCDAEEMARRFVVDGVLLDSFFGMVEVRVRTLRKDIKPLHPIIDSGRLLFPYYDEWTPLTIWSEEIKAAQSHPGGAVYEYEFVSGMWSDRAPYLKDFFQDSFQDKADYKKAGMSALVASAKVIVNSGYGFWALRWCNRNGVGVFHKSKSPAHEYLEDDRLVSMDVIGDYDLLRFEHTMDVKETNVMIGAAITSYARTRLWNLISDIEATRGPDGELYTVSYCDTDSIITNCDMSRHPELMAEYIWDVTGEELGSLKNEADDLLKDELGSAESKRILKLWSAKIGSPHVPFSSWAISGNKVYGLELTIPDLGTEHDGKKFKITKVKGFSQKGQYGTVVSFEDMRQLARVDVDEDGTPLSTPLRQTQMQFRSGKQRLECATGTIRAIGSAEKAEALYAENEALKAAGPVVVQGSAPSAIGRVEAPFCTINKTFVVKNVRNQYTKGVTDIATGIVTPRVYEGEGDAHISVSEINAKVKGRYEQKFQKKLKRLGGKLIVSSSENVSGHTYEHVYEMEKAWVVGFVAAQDSDAVWILNKNFDYYIRMRHKIEHRSELAAFAIKHLRIKAENACTRKLVAMIRPYNGPAVQQSKPYKFPARVAKTKAVQEDVVDDDAPSFMQFWNEDCGDDNDDYDDDNDDYEQPDLGYYYDPVYVTGDNIDYNAG